eukprot:gnl/TRDRNA2_/TRDRNA2_155160_c0_seq1.p1 gnl/TRDRNA2_/TRDRNA2_155160_c0~~gnl/TRDRNA2_/TRDRNA2_155160_c0_seq1.p1  ORF type:complete len:852 (+),score=181.31 gnl/TRDRNA2_/TRDRNA2_155160_c0_seq1:84-2639(+)
MGCGCCKAGAGSAPDAPDREALREADIKRLEQTLQQELQQLRIEADREADEEARVLEKEAEDAEKKRVAGKEKLQAISSEVQSERDRILRLASALRDWRVEGRQLSSNISPRRPQLLVEVWAVNRTGVPIGGGGSAGGAHVLGLLGETWIPYAAARAAGAAAAAGGPSTHCEWELPLEPRLGVARDAVAKLQPWPDMPQAASRVKLLELATATAKAAEQAASMRWHVKLGVSHAGAVPPWKTARDQREWFSFQVLSLQGEPAAGAKSQSPAALGLAAVVQVWQWGGAAAAAAGTNQEPRPQRGVLQRSPRSPRESPRGISGGPPARVRWEDDPWQLIFESKSANFLKATGTKSDDGHPVRVAQFSDQFKVELPACLVLDAGSRAGTPRGKSKAAEDDERELIALKAEARQKASACENLVAASAELRVAKDAGLRATASAVGAKKRQAADNETLRSDAEWLSEEIERLKAELRRIEQSMPPPLNSGVPSSFNTSRIPPAPDSAESHRRAASSPPTSPGRPAPGSSATTAPRNRNPLLGPGPRSRMLFEDSVLQVHSSWAPPTDREKSKGLPPGQLELHLCPRVSGIRISSFRLTFSDPLGSGEISGKSGGRGLAVGLSPTATVGLFPGRPHAVTQRLRLELNGIFSHPAVARAESKLTGENTPQGGIASASTHCCEFVLPVDITTFFVPLETNSVAEAWNRARCSRRWELPSDMREALRSCSMQEITKLASCGGAFQEVAPHLRVSGVPVLAGALPPHGNVKATLVCFVAVSEERSNGAIEIALRADDEGLASAVLQAVAGWLSPGKRSLSPGTGAKSRPLSSPGMPSPPPPPPPPPMATPAGRQRIGMVSI